MKTSKNKGFTLLEILLVIAAIGILASIVIVAINPLRQISKSENASRWSNINTIQKALDQYYIANGKYPDEVVTNATGEYKEICIGGQPVGCIELETELVPAYIAEIPRDPNGGGYKVGINPTNNSISVWADKSEINETVSINNFVPSGSVLFAKNMISSGWDTEDPNLYNESKGSVAIDNEGNYIVTGSFWSEEINLGNDINGIPVILTDIGEGDGAGYIAKYNKNEDLLWARSITGKYEEYPWTITTYNNDIYISGFSWWTMDFGNDINGNAINFNFDVSDSVGFIVKYNEGGGLVWVKLMQNSNIAGTLYDDSESYSHSHDNQGNIVVVGSFGQPINLGNDINGNPINLVNDGGANDMYVTKYNPNGDLLWGKSAGSLYFDSGYNVKTDTSNNIFIVGGFSRFGEMSSPISFGNNTTGNSVILTSIDDAGFIAKYDPNGTIVWAKSVTPPLGFTDTIFLDIELDSQNNILVGGFAHLNSTLGQDINGNFVSVSGNFIAKYNNNGDILWAKSNDYGGNFTLDNLDNIFVYLQGSVMKYDNNGDLINVNAYSNILTDVQSSDMSLLVDNQDNLILSFLYDGDYNNPLINIGKDSNGQDVILNSGGSSHFIIKYSK